MIHLFYPLSTPINHRINRYKPLMTHHQPLNSPHAAGNVVNTAEVNEAAAEAECSACGGEWLEAGGMAW